VAADDNAKRINRDNGRRATIARRESSSGREAPGGAERAWLTVTEANTAENATKTKLFFVPVLPFALTCSAFAQVDHPLIKNKPDSPLQITEAHCGLNPPRSYQPGMPPQETYYCHATLQFADTNDTWDGYGLAWILTYENGTKSYNYQASDRSIPPPPGVEKGKTSFQPREIVEAGRAGGPGFGVKNRDGKTLRPTDAEVEVEFVINTDGTVWGDSKSPRYLQMLARRKQAIEAVDSPGSNPDHPKEDQGPALVKMRPGHVPVMATNPETLLPEPGEFRLFNPVLIRDNQVLLNMADSRGAATETDPAMALYSPGLGRFVFSTVPFQGAIEGKLQFSQISFTLEDKSYLLLTGAQISRSGRIWVLHQPEWRPVGFRSWRPEDEPMMEASSLQILLAEK